MQIVPNGADTTVFLPAPGAEARARLGLPDDGPIVSYVGKLVPRKGVDTLVEAMGLLARRPRGRAAAGGGRHRRDAPGPGAPAAELGVAERVRFVGKVAHDEVGWWMAAGDLFVLPSLSEGLPTVVCEAMNCGLPGGRHGGGRHARDRARRRDRAAGAALATPRALADGPGRVLDDPALARAAWARRPCASGAGEYTWEANARRMTEIYEGLRG